MKNEKKELEYATKIIGAIGEILSEDSDSDFKIDIKELEEGDNLTHFIHALSNLAPSHIYSNFTGDEKNMIQFNHVANQLCFQYSIKNK